jgi:hypothetical protein
LVTDKGPVIAVIFIGHSLLDSPPL